MEEQKLLKKKYKYLKDGNKALLVATFNDLAELYLRESKYEKSIEAYSNAVKLYKEIGDRKSYAKANRMLGEVYMTIGQYEKAIKYEKNYLAIARETNDKEEEQRALATIGRTYLTAAISNPYEIDYENLNLAQSAFLKSLKICDNLKNISKHELGDMRARLLLNIGLVQENQENYDSAIEYMSQCIKLCKAHEIFDQLQHSYRSMGLLYSKKGDCSKAISYLNLAYEVASRLSDKIPAMASVLIAKSEVLLKLADFQSAKKVLLKAYKLNTPNEEEREQIQQNLKVVAALSYTEESLLTIADSDYKLKKKLYEKMGDGACILKLYTKAIDYYKKMLDYAELSGETGKDLIPVYVSLAQTYKDNKQYDLAIEYFQKEYNISQSNPKESYSTLINIAEVCELAKKSYEDVVKAYEKARLVAAETGDAEKEGVVISKFVKVMKKYGKEEEAECLEKKLMRMGNIEGSSDSEEEESGTPNIGDDINISDISDESETSDTEEVKTVMRTRKKGSKLTIKKNLKGETALHTACIDGNVTLVQRLLDQGHTVNVRDNAGWLPIHEACINGHQEIVEMLVKKGANVNDKGGRDCEGVTPLHDACCNGHLEIVEYLLGHGANILLQNDNGETALDTLRQWRELQTDLDTFQQKLYEKLVYRMTVVLEKAGRSTSPLTKKRKLNAYTTQLNQTPQKTNLKRRSLENINKKSPVLIRSVTSEEDLRNVSKKLKNSPMGLSSSRRSLDRFNSDDSIGSKKKSFSPRGKPVGTLRYMVDKGSSDEDIPSCSNSSRERLRVRTSEVTSSLDLENSQNDTDESDIENSARNQYKRVMESLRNRLPEKPVKSNKSKKYAIISANEIDDDWLENDLQPSKKRKVGSILKQNFFNTSTIRKSDSPVKIIENRSISDENDIQIVSDVEIDVDEQSNDSSSSVKRKKSQISLLDSGFSRYCTSPERTANTTGSINKSYRRQSKISRFTVPADVLEPDSTTSIMDVTIASQLSNVSTINRAMCAISVRIENKLWRVPVPANEISELSIGWLASEAAKRYYSKEGIRPTLQLETKDGAILVNEDPLSIVFLSPAQPEEVQSTVVSWNLPPLPERYLEVCNNLKIESDSNLRQRLDEAQGTLCLNFSRFDLNKVQITPLFRSLNRENTLQVIDLSGCMILNEGVQYLSASMASLIQLRSLNLSMNNLTSEAVRYLSNIFVDHRMILENFYELNLSYNLLTDDCLHYLSIILNNVKLRRLNISGCNLTDEIFDINPFINLNLNHLETFDVSYNNLGKKSICKFLSHLNLTIVTSLNFSHNKVTESGIGKEIALSLENSVENNLKSLNLARCKVNDAEIWDLLRFVSMESNLKLLNLSYNNELTSVTLRRLIQCKLPPEILYLEGCDNIFQYFNESSSNVWTFDKSFPISTLKSLKISLKYKEKPKETEYISMLWEQEWGQKAKITKLFNSFVHLSLRD